jgi:hypothetical protein
MATALQSQQSLHPKQNSAGSTYIQSPVMSSGHLMIFALFSNQCEAKMLQLDAQLDDPQFVDQLYAQLHQSGPVSLLSRRLEDFLGEYPNIVRLIFGHRCRKRYYDCR